MGHRPHLLLPGPWNDPSILLTDAIRHHLTTVLRRDPGSAVTYTDGEGALGAGTTTLDSVERGEETRQARSRAVHLFVAPPRSKDRQRFLVEKVSELGAASLTWLTGIRFGQGSPPRVDRCQAWADAALCQSRGVHRTIVNHDVVHIQDLPDHAWVADPGGAPIASVCEPEVSVAIGPEGGWAPEEVATVGRRLDLGTRTLRVETAAVVVTARALLG